ncbi:ferredoxin [Prauserella muralis]|uniref:Uncharacterized protein n=1 Tax=Prauserella muralis TaxID=588067 RepID=A0A2V4AV95_9PSEU|nr:ferredoxin [Prauserella muralis]PXY19457.1 hypothetical protein BAY60_32475 [Prauserella muralis]TWE29434.1 hypothetical protein FHX69_2119 [Prauserella muralis]
MTQPPPAPLGAQEQQQLIQRIGQAIAAVAPAGWRRLHAEYRAVGRHVEADLTVVGADGTPRPLPPPSEAVRLFGRLRTGMYEPGRGTWLGAALTVEPPANAYADFTYHQEPRWRRVPPPIGFQDELRFFPRPDNAVPAWLRQRAAGRQPDESPARAAEPEPRAEAPSSASAPAPSAPGVSLRTPRVYDGLDDDGRPVVTRAPLTPAERDLVLDYLNAAPVVLSARSYDTDAFAPEREPAVPLNFRTDGTWVWPGAVAYYLREHGVAPDPELTAHIRARGFTLPEVGEPARELAVATVTGQPSTAD